MYLGRAETSLVLRSSRTGYGVPAELSVAVRGPLWWDLVLGLTLLLLGWQETLATLSYPPDGTESQNSLSHESWGLVLELTHQDAAPAHE